MNPIEEYRYSQQILFEKEGIRPRSEMLATGGPVKNVHFLEMGKGKPLIMLHGGGSHASEWISILKPLAEHFHVYAIDRPGHGLTGAYNYRGSSLPLHATRFVTSFMDAMGIDKAFFLAHSMGGYFSLCFSLACPQRVEKLVLIGASAGLNRWIPPILRLLGTKRLNSLLTKTVAKPSISGIKSIYKQLLVAHLEKLSDEYYRHCYLGQKLPGYLTSFTSLLENVLSLKGWKKDLNLAGRLGELAMPVGFIWGEEDAFEKPGTGRQKAAAIKEHRFETVKDAGHAAWLDRPEECAALIISMLKE